MIGVKEKREIVFIVGSVALVVLFGILISLIGSDDGISTGKAIDIDSNHPTYAGLLHILETQGSWVSSTNESCNDVCDSLNAICIPLESTCSDVVSGNCRCVEVPQ